MLNTYNLDIVDLHKKLISSGIFTRIEQGKLILAVWSQKEKAQEIIDVIFYKMPNLLPVQFYYLLAKTGLDHSINQMLEEIKDSEREKYAMYKAYLTGARYFQFSKTYLMYEDIKHKLDDHLKFDLDQVKSLWLSASHV